MAASPVKRRNLEYTEIYQGSLATDDLALDASQQDLLRAAARKWASKSKWELGSFSSVTFTPTDEWLCSALCYMHVECHSRSGSSFRFTGRLNDGVYRLRVEQAGECGPTQRKARAAKRFNADEITVEDRRAVVDCAEQLMASFRKATTAAVVKRLAADGRSLPTARVRAILRWMRKQGTATKQFRESQLIFAKFVTSVDTADMNFTFRQEQPFRWVAQLTGFLDQLQSLASENSKIFITADFTFRLTVMNYSYGILCNLPATFLCAKLV